MATSIIACVHMARGQPLLWLDSLIKDIPVSVAAETGGAGDDIRLRLKAGDTVEVQVKKGLRADHRLWDALLALGAAVHAGTVNYGVLVVSPDSSRTIRSELARDIERVGDGRNEGLSDIGASFMAKLRDAGLAAGAVCQRLRVVVVEVTPAGGAAILAARAELAHLVAADTEITAAWNALYKDAAELIARRGRRDAASVTRVLRAEGVRLASTAAAVPAVVLDRLSRWTLATNASFHIFGIRKALPIDEAWLPLRAVVREEREAEDGSLAEALASYHAWGGRPTPRDAVDVHPETLGRFVTHVVVVAGPGMGKSTLLTRIARRYAEDRVPVLRVRLPAVAARMQKGSGFEEALFSLALDGSDIPIETARGAGFAGWLLLCDGLDECGPLQDEVAAGILRFASGHPRSRAVVTTRPMGYSTPRLADWRHYDLLPLERSAAPAHLATLLGAIAEEGPPLSQHAITSAQLELDAGKVGYIVARSPRLLGLAASITARGRSLGRTREKLYERIFELIDDAPNARVPVPPAPAVVLRRFLDILGWQVVADPVSPVGDTVERCAQLLAAETGEKPLAARSAAEVYLGYWQDVGMVERVGHGGDETLTFIHKTFGEFAAARHLRAMPPDEQQTTVPSIVASEAWAEVVKFAGLLGPAATVVEALLEKATTQSGGVGPAARALELLTETAHPPGRPLREQLVARAFEFVRSARRSWAYDVGEQLVAAARRFPDEVGSSAAPLTSHEQLWTRHVAWACALAAGPAHFDLEALIDAVRTGPAQMDIGLSPSLGGGSMLPYDSRHRLIGEYVLAAAREIIDRCPPDRSDEIVPAVLNVRALASVRFVSSVRELLETKGKHYPLDQLGLDRSWQMPMLSAGYVDAQRTAYDAIFEGLGAEAPREGAPGGEPGVLLHLSAFLRTSGFWQVPIADVWGWRRPYDRAAVRETLRGLICASGVDRELLQREVEAAALHLRRSENRLDALSDITIDVDVPPIDWLAAKTLDLDLGKVEAAVHHGSRWIVWAAANLLASFSGPEELDVIVPRLLQSGHGLAIQAAADLAKKLELPRAFARALERLARPLARGCEYLFALLIHAEVPHDGRTLAALEAGLLTEDVTTAVKAAELAGKLARPGLEDLATLLERAFSHWQTHEEPYPQTDGFVPESPRAKIVTALSKVRALGFDELRAYVRDSRSDVVDAGLRVLIHRLATDEGLQKTFMQAIAQREIAPHALGEALAKNVPLTASSIEAVGQLLDNPDPKIRFSAMGLLNNHYLSTERICARAQVLTSDTEQQIRDRAFHILDELMLAHGNCV